MEALHTNIIYAQIYRSICGDLILGSYGEHLCLCDWVNERRSLNIYKRLYSALCATMEYKASEITQRASIQLDEYFERERKSFDIPLLLVGTPFQKNVWNKLLEIPYGETCSYGMLAQQLGVPKAVRAVANANAANVISIFVPCHRIIGSNHSLTGYVGGLHAKSTLLALEKSIKE